MTLTGRELAFLLRFFHVVPPVPPMMTWTFGVLTITSGTVIASEPSRAAGALAPVLLLQAFAASSGFVVPARRGHYDLLLTRSNSRTLIALGHWASSVAPGAASWLALAILELAVSGGAHPHLLASGTLAALFLVSTLPWALTVPLPRFSGGIGWLLVLVTYATTFANGLPGTWTVVSTRIEEVARAGWLFFLYPIAAVGQPLERAQFMAAAPALALALSAMIAACRWIARRDVPLEAAQ